MKKILILTTIILFFINNSFGLADLNDFLNKVFIPTYTIVDKIPDQIKEMKDAAKEINPKIEKFNQKSNKENAGPLLGSLVKFLTPTKTTLLGSYDKATNKYQPGLLVNLIEILNSLITIAGRVSTSLAATQNYKDAKNYFEKTAELTSKLGSFTKDLQEILVTFNSLAFILSPQEAAKNTPVETIAPVTLPPDAPPAEIGSRLDD